MDRIVHIGLSIAATLLFAECYDDAPTPGESFDGQLPPATLTLGELLEQHTTIPHPINRAEVVHATVTTSNDENNFSRWLLLEDRGAALAVLVGSSSAANEHYPCHCHVALRLEGLLLGDTLGMVCVGVTPPPGSRQSIAPIESRQQLDRLLVRDGRTQPLAPLRTTLAELPGLCPGRLIRIDGLRYNAGCEDGCVGTDDLAIWSGYRYFVAADGRRVHTSPSPYARFAPYPIPDTPLCLTGILQRHRVYGYLLKPRSMADLGIAEP